MDQQISVSSLCEMAEGVESLQKALKILLDKTEEQMPEKKDIYSNWIEEEYNEFKAEKDGTPEQYKELMDTMWCCIQKANKQGYNIALGFKALIHEYTSKFYTKDGEYQPIYREDGKLLKNTGFKKADFKKFFEEK